MCSACKWGDIGSGRVIVSKSRGRRQGRREADAVVIAVVIGVVPEEEEGATGTRVVWLACALSVEPRMEDGAVWVEHVEELISVRTN